MNGQRLEATLAAKEGARRRVLVVDDSHDARAILKLLLTKLGHETREAEDAESGMAVSREFRPEVVFCDIVLSGKMSGYSFAKAARQESTFRDSCIVAVSGWEGPDHEQQAYEAGFDRVLQKPVELTELATILQTLPRRVAQATKT
ncbi:MAG TPA: response regulator [Planctomycetaceae bacterium]|jgi:CheY-like chemotaxis protein|nr:response regulator [Planctomycetaceae bacterium]